MSTATLTITALFLITVAASASTASGSSIALSNFSVSPKQATKGTSVTGSVTIQNLDMKNAVTVVVTFFDGGAQVADNSANPLSIAEGGTTTVQLQFDTVAVPPHCYSAEATPGPVSTGYCEPGGHILSGAQVPTGSLIILASGLGAVSVAIAGAVVAVSRRRRTN